jgi:hypothetical protein
VWQGKGEVLEPAKSILGLARGRRGCLLRAIRRSVEQLSIAPFFGIETRAGAASEPLPGGDRFLGSLLTRCWREPDSNSPSHPERERSEEAPQGPRTAPGFGVAPS